MRKAKRNTEIVNEMKGTCKIASALHPEVEIEEIEEIMLDANCEVCSGCGWWISCGELASNDEEYDQCVCDQCLSG